MTENNKRIVAMNTAWQSRMKYNFLAPFQRFNCVKTAFIDVGYKLQGKLQRE